MKTDSVYHAIQYLPVSDIAASPGVYLRAKEPLGRHHRLISVISQWASLGAGTHCSCIYYRPSVLLQILHMCSSDSQCSDFINPL